MSSNHDSRPSSLDRTILRNRMPTRKANPSSQPARRWMLAASGCLLVCTASIASAASYYVDPAVGKITNSGTAASPWNTLEAVFTAKKTFAPGDVIYLKNGYHGAPVVKGINTGNVTIQAENGHVPKLRKLTVTGASRWIISGLDISPVHAGSSSYDTGSHVDIQSTSNYITVKQSTIRSVPSVAGFSTTQWPARTGTGVALAAHHSTILDNKIENVKFGIVVSRQATNSQIAHNAVKNFMSDGLRALASYCKFEYNTVLNNYKVDSNHDDAFQSWTGGYDGIPVGGTTIYNVEVRGNIFANHTDPNQPYKTGMQGIGLFDGTYENWVIENNLIVTETWHGISLYGAKNCRVVNNTVVENPINSSTNTPWIMITNHKNGKASTGCIVRNNLTSTLNAPASVGTVDHNIVTKAYNDHFVNYAGFNFDLKNTSPAVNAGVETSAPALDLDELPRTAPYDVGAYEFQSGETQPTPEPPPTGQTYQSTTQWQNVPFSTQSGTFRVSFTMTPSATGIDTVTGLSRTTAAAFTDLAPAIRFAPTGVIDARNGSTYQAATALRYAANVPYNVVLTVNVATRRYSATVTAPGKTPVTIASNYAFRTEQASVNQLSNFALIAVKGSHTVSNLSVETN